MFADLREALNAALRTVKGLRVDSSGWMGADPPAASVGPPAYGWESYAADPTSVSINVALYVPADERALQRLDALLPLVVDALETVDNAVVSNATPEPFTFGGAVLPAYRITVEVT